MCLQLKPDARTVFPMIILFLYFSSKKWVTDSNAVAQEKGVDAVCALLKDSGENAARFVAHGLFSKAIESHASFTPALDPM
jgi:hypothetical protein